MFIIFPHWNFAVKIPNNYITIILKNSICLQQLEISHQHLSHINKIQKNNIKFFFGKSSLSTVL